jgi:glycosyltransferase involved in cell wall biosynthesis
MNVKKISVLIKTLNRFEIIKECFEHNDKAMRVDLDPKIEIEYLVCDNGSSDGRIIDYFKPIATYHRINKQNEGCAKADNQLYLRSTGDVIVWLGSDNILAEGCIAAAIKELGQMKRPGAIGISDGAPEIRGEGWITGVFVIARSAINEIGFLHDGFDVYGCEDLDFNERLKVNGIETKMLAGFVGSHSPHRPGDSWSYRAMKYNSFIKNLVVLEERQKQMRAGTLKTEPLPPLREPR